MIREKLLNKLNLYDELIDIYSLEIEKAKKYKEELIVSKDKLRFELNALEENIDEISYVIIKHNEELKTVTKEREIILQKIETKKIMY